MSSEAKVLYQVKGNIAVITLNRPKQRNAQDLDLIQQLDACWERAAEDRQVKVIVLNANGPHFSAGHDISQAAMDQVEEVDWDGGGEVVADIYHYEKKYFNEFCTKWRNIPKPSIAAVQGACIAAGLMLAWPCDPPRGWWIITRELVSADRLPCAPAASSTAPMLAAWPMLMVTTSFVMYCIVS